MMTISDGSTTKHAVDWTQTVTVVMINRDGGDWLRQSLRSLRYCIEKTDHPNWTIDFVLVDNGSTDQSMAIADVELDGASFEHRVVMEPTPGVNFARNKGLTVCRGKYVIFVDNDILFDDGWLQGYLDGFTRHREPKIFAGRVRIGKVETPAPSWLDLDGPYAWTSIVVRCDNGDQDCRSAVGDPSVHGPVGPNMAFERQMLVDAGGFDTRFGLRPGSLVPGAETELFHRLAKSQHDFVYLANASVRHPLKRNQIQKAYFLRRLEGTGRVMSRIQSDEGFQCPRIFGVKRYLFREYVDMYAKMLAAAPGGPRRRFHARCRVAVTRGKIKEDFAAYRSRPRNQHV